MQSSLSKPNFPVEILELEKMANAEPDNLIYKIALASALQEAAYFNEAADYYRQAQALDTDKIYAETIDKALAELEPYVDPIENEVEQVAETPKLPEVMIYPPGIADLQKSALEDPDDLVAQITFANALEEGGYLTDAIAIYQQLKLQDKDGLFHGTCDQAIANLESQLVASESVSTPTAEWTPIARPTVEVSDEELDQERSNLTLQRRWANLPIAAKQFTAILGSSVLTVFGVVGTGMAIALITGQAQLKNQTLAELVVVDNNYNVKVNQMGFGFRGQSDNVAIIEAAKLYADKQPLPPELQTQVQRILQNEIKSRNIEYATLVGNDQKIIMGGNAERMGESFNPSNLVTLRMGFPGQINTSATVSKQDLVKESPPTLDQITGNDALIRYSVTPVRDPQSRRFLGTLISGDVVNGKDTIVANTVEAFKGGYSAVYYLDSGGNFELATSALVTSGIDDSQLEVQSNVPLSNLDILKQAQANPDQPVTTRLSIEGKPLTIAVDTVKDVNNKPIAFIVRGTSEEGLNALLERTILLQMGVGGLMLLLSGILAYLLGRALTRPIENLQMTAQKLGEGESNVRAEVKSKDEVGQLASTFNKMAERIETFTQSLQKTSEERQKEAETQRQQKEALQDGVVRLLTDIEESAKGNLTVRSSVEAGAVGAISDAFNATLDGLRKLVKQVVDTAADVSVQAQQDSQEIIGLSDNALAQTRALESATASVAEMAKSIESVANSAQTAAAIARQGNEAAQKGQNTMDETVNSIYKVRGRVAEISKKSKRLAESSLEISKIVGIISGISEKTNLLAFNASIEAARAGENGQGFRIVADEVRRLAEMVTLSAQEIEQVILSIQEETSQMSQLMEESTNEVVTGTQLVQQTKETLQSLTQINEEIDTLLQSISQNTESQRLASLSVTETVQNVTGVAKETSDKSQQVSSSLQALAKTAVELQTAASQFKVD
ncbi:MAG: methyl-accepting chemotaxis protein [Synechocystis sp.]|nr:methyl-accepting chemotaxis protein [Synechocystis sp.]